MRGRLLAALEGALGAVAEQPPESKAMAGLSNQTTFGVAAIKDMDNDPKVCLSLIHI